MGKKRAIVTAMRVVGDKEGEGGKVDGSDNKAYSTANI
jgi:hypothetical protein